MNRGTNTPKNGSTVAQFEYVLFDPVCACVRVRVVDTIIQRIGDVECLNLLWQGKTLGLRHNLLGRKALSDHELSQITNHLRRRRDLDDE